MKRIKLIVGFIAICISLQGATIIQTNNIIQTGTFTVSNNISVIGGIYDGNGSGITNIPVSAISGAGSAITNESDDFYLASNPSSFIDANVTALPEVKYLGDSTAPEYNIDLNQGLLQYGTSPRLSFGDTRALLNGAWTVADATMTTEIVNYQTMTNHTLPVRGFDSAPATWDATWNTLSLAMIDGTTLQLGQENHTVVRNTSGITITNGKVCRIAFGNGIYTGVELANATNTWKDSLSIIGLATQSITNNTVGKITIIGNVNELNTSAYEEGSNLWLSATIAGELTMEIPTNNNLHQPLIGTCLHKHNNEGRILVEIQKVPHADDIGAYLASNPSGYVNQATVNTSVSNWSASPATSPVKLSGASYIHTDSDETEFIAQAGNVDDGDYSPAINMFPTNYTEASSRGAINIVAGGTNINGGSGFNGVINFAVNGKTSIPISPIASIGADGNWDFYGHSISNIGGGSARLDLSAGTTAIDATGGTAVVNYQTMTNKLIAYSTSNQQATVTDNAVAGWYNYPMLGDVTYTGSRRFVAGDANSFGGIFGDLEDGSLQYLIVVGTNYQDDAAFRGDIVASVKNGIGEIVWARDGVPVMYMDTTNNIRILGEKVVANNGTARLDLSAGTTVSNATLSGNGVGVTNTPLNSGFPFPLGVLSAAGNGTMSFDNGTRTFTFDPNGTIRYTTKNEFWWSLSTNVTATISDVEGLHYIYFEPFNGRLTNTTTAWTIIGGEAQLAQLYWDKANQQCLYIGDERHGKDIPDTEHIEHHRFESARWYSGGTLIHNALGGTTAGSASASNTVIALQPCVIWDDDHTNGSKAYGNQTAVTYTNSGGIFYNWYATGLVASVNWRTNGATEFPFMIAPAGNTPMFNQLSGGVWSTNVVPEDNYFISWLVQVPSYSDDAVFIIPDSQTFASVTGAQARTYINILENRNVDIVGEMKPLYRLIFLKNQSAVGAMPATIKYTKLVEVQDLRIGNNNPTVGLSGSQADLSVFLTLDGSRAMTGDLNGGGNQSTNWSVVSANSIVLNGVTLNTNLQAISNVQRSNDVLVASSTNTLAWTNIPTMAGFNLTFSTSNHPFGMGILNGTQGMYFVTYSNATVYTNWNLGR